LTEFIFRDDGIPQILLMDGKAIVGHVTLAFSTDEKGHPFAEIGYEIPENLRGNGVATACVRTICVHAWRLTIAKRIDALTHPDNVASRRVLEKNGFEYTGEIVNGFVRFTLARPAARVPA